MRVTGKGVEKEEYLKRADFVLLDKSISPEKTIYNSVDSEKPYFRAVSGLRLRRISCSFAGALCIPQKIIIIYNVYVLGILFIIMRVRLYE